jgi:hypothetical protein
MRCAMGPQTLLLVPSYTYGLATDGRFRNP